MSKQSALKQQETKKRILQTKSLVQRFQYIFMTRIKKCFNRLLWADRIEEYIPQSNDNAKMYTSAVTKKLSKELRSFYVKKVEKKTKDRLETAYTQGLMVESMMIVKKYTKKEQNPQLNESKLFYQLANSKMSQCQKKIEMLRVSERQRSELNKKMSQVTA